MHRPRQRLLAALLGPAVLVAACGGDDGDAAEAGPKPDRVGLVYDVGGLGDLGFNDAALLALTRAEDELDLTVQTFETDDNGSDREDLLRLLAGDDIDLVVAVGSGFRAAVEDVAPDYPDTRFAIVDDDGPDAPNVTALAFADEQVAYLAGAAAALASGTHRVGFIGGTDVERTRRSQAGFTAGARRITPGAKVDVAYLPPPADGAFDPVALRDIALGQYRGGADVLFGVPAAVGAGLLAAATEHGPGARAVGFAVDVSAVADPAVRGAILTSVVKRVDLVVFEAIQAFVEGTLEPGTLEFGVPEDAVAVVGGLPPAQQAQLDQLVAELVAGQIQVPTVP